MPKYHFYVCLIAIASTIGFTHGQAGELTIVGGSEGTTNLDLEVKGGTPPYTYIFDKGLKSERTVADDTRTLLSFYAEYYAAYPTSYIRIRADYGEHYLFVRDSAGKEAQVTFLIKHVPNGKAWVW